MFSVKCVPKDYRKMLTLDNATIYQKYKDFIGVVSIPLYSKKFYLKISKVEEKYIQLDEFDKFKDSVIDLCLTVVKVLNNRDEYRNSAILLMKPVHLSTIFLAASLLTFMAENNVRNPCIYSLSQILYETFYKLHKFEESKMLKSLQV